MDYAIFYHLDRDAFKAMRMLIKVLVARFFDFQLTLLDSYWAYLKPVQELATEVSRPSPFLMVSALGTIWTRQD
jgi:hypothetical protein